MAHTAPTFTDILNSATAAAMPSAKELPSTSLRNYYQAIDNMIRVFAIRPGENVLFLTDPLLDRRVVDAVSGIAASRGARITEFMGTSSQISVIPEEAKPVIEKADFV